ncbi:MAG: MBL fold metallo-hydrolase [Actinomycetota bacterium]
MTHVFAHLQVGPLGCNCYIVGDPEQRKAIVIDPGGDVDVLIERLAEDQLEVTAIVATHAHFDHVLAAEALRAHTGAPFYMHAEDKPILDWLEESGRLFLGIELGPPPEVDTTVSEGDELAAGAERLQVIHTPGHSPGSISLLGDRVLFAGDTLFAGSIGRSDLPGGDGRLLVSSIQEKLFALDGDVQVLPGHGPATTLEQEIAHNPFVGARSRFWLPGS